MFCNTENELFVKNIANIISKDKFLFPIIHTFGDAETIGNDKRPLITSMLYFYNAAE